MTPGLFTRSGSAQSALLSAPAPDRRREGVRVRVSVGNTHLELENLADDQVVPIMQQLFPHGVHQALASPTVGAGSGHDADALMPLTDDELERLMREIDSSADDELLDLPVAHDCPRSLAVFRRVAQDALASGLIDHETMAALEPATLTQVTALAVLDFVGRALNPARPLQASDCDLEVFALQDVGLASVLGLARDDFDLSTPRLKRLLLADVRRALCAGPDTQEGDGDLLVDEHAARVQRLAHKISNVAAATFASDRAVLSALLQEAWPRAAD